MTDHEAEYAFWLELATTVPEWYEAVKSASEMHLLKSKMYGLNTDPYENFYLGARINGLTPLQQGEALMSKHQAALSLWRVRWGSAGDPPTTSASDDGIIDRAVYAIINLILYRRTYARKSQPLGTDYEQGSGPAEVTVLQRGTSSGPWNEGGFVLDQRRQEASDDGTAPTVGSFGEGGRPQAGPTDIREGRGRSSHPSRKDT